MIELRRVPKDESSRRIDEYETRRRGGRQLQDLTVDEARELLKKATAARADRFRIEGVRFPLMDFRTAVWRSVDVINADLTWLTPKKPRLRPGPWFVDCRFERTQFDHAAWRRIKFERCHFASCQWSAGYLERCDITSCVFESCRFSDVNIKSSTIRSSAFRDIAAKRLSFRDCSLTDMSISGSLNGALFYAVTFNAVDLRDAVITDSSIGDLIAGNVAFPQHPQSFVVRPEAFARVRSEVSEVLSPRALVSYDRITSMTSPYEVVDESRFDFGDDENLGGITLDERRAILECLYPHRVATSQN